MQTPDSVMLLGTLIPVLSILLGGLLLLVPVAGLTIRFALKPAMEVLAVARAVRGAEEERLLLERRVAFLEQQLAGATLLRLLEGGIPEQRTAGTALESVTPAYAATRAAHD